MNRYRPHVYIIPEDDRNRQIANGFVCHHAVDHRRMQVMPSAGGWRSVLDSFEQEYIRTLRGCQQAHVVIVIDFNGHIDERRRAFAQAIPEDLRDRVFVIGSKGEPETLKVALNITFEEIGQSLASDCDEDTAHHWSHEQLVHNDAERQRLVGTVKPFLFPAGRRSD